MKSRYRKRSQKRQKRTRRRGGSPYYYEYNRNPMLFTNTTSQIFKGGDPRSTLLPTPLVRSVENIGHSSSNFWNHFNGNYLSPSPSVLSQPINKM